MSHGFIKGVNGGCFVLINKSYYVQSAFMCNPGPMWNVCQGPLWFYDRPLSSLGLFHWALLFLIMAIFQFYGQNLANIKYVICRSVKVHGTGPWIETSAS